MARQQKLRDFQTILLLDSDYDTEDMILDQLLTDEFDAKKDLLEAKLRGPFSLEEQTDSWCIEYCRFSKVDLYRLMDVMHLPEEVILDNRCRLSGSEAFIILLCRLSYPNRLGHHVKRFARSESYISRVVTYMLNFLFDRYHNLIQNIQQPYLDLAHMAELVGNISPIKNCIGFIDGTVRGMCRPTYDQKTSFNGHKRKHAIKFQSVMAPNGIIIALHGPFEGKRHDAYLLAQSDIMDQMSRLPLMENGIKYCLYGDPAYPRLPQLVPPHRGNALTAEQQQFNQKMSKARESVEYGFGKIEKYWSFCDFKKNLKLYLQPIGKLYIVATLLTNCHTCLYKCNVNSLFDSEPPTLEEYLSD